MAYSNGGGIQHHQDEAPDPQFAQNSHHGGGGGSITSQTQTGDDQGQGSGSGGGAGGSGVSDQQFASNDGPRVYGPGDDHDGGGPNGLMPNGEDGLMALASYVQTHGGDGGHENSTDNSDHTPGGSRDSGQTNGGDGSTKVAGNGATFQGSGGEGGNGGFGLGGDGGSGGNGGFGGASGGFGSGGGGGGGFTPGLGGNGGSGGAGGDGSTGGSGGSGGDGGDGGFSLPTAGDGGTGGTGGAGSDGGGKICVVSAITTCGSSDNGGPTTFTPFFSAGPATDEVATDPVPEPAAWGLMILGFVGAGALLRTRRRKALAA